MLRVQGVIVNNEQRTMKLKTETLKQNQQIGNLAQQVANNAAYAAAGRQTTTTAPTSTTAHFNLEGQDQT